MLIFLNLFLSHLFSIGMLYIYKMLNILKLLKISKLKKTIINSEQTNKLKKS